MRPGTEKRAAVALSGGVDSAAASVLMTRDEFELVGLTMITCEGPESSSAVEASREIARHLGIEHHVLDLHTEFERLVVRPFVSEYSTGLTPNPCVTCNRDIKFGALLRAAVEAGCTRMATGHYARLSDVGGGGRQLARAKDRSKDQSYVLWTLDQERLTRLLFPLGEVSRADAVKIAREAGLSRYTRPESQDICFLSGGSYHDAVLRLAPESVRPGPILDTGGRVIGTHRGLPFYTVGQRRGLGLGAAVPLYVLELRPGDNTIVVGGRDLLDCDGFEVEKVSFTGEPPPREYQCNVVTRYRGPVFRANLTTARDGAGSVRYEAPGPPAAPGQSAVFYEGDRVIGGGVIARNTSGAGPAGR